MPVLLPLNRNVRVPTHLRAAQNYADWAVLAQEYDREQGLDLWKRTEPSRRYDHRLIRNRLNLIHSARRKRDYGKLLFLLNEGIHGNLGGMGKPELYSKALFGTKDLIHQYIDEVCKALNEIAEVDDEIIPEATKRDFFIRADLCYGHSALMLSGGAVLGFFHAGVLKALYNEGLLPKVISGSSAGAILAAIACTHSDDTLQDKLSLNNLYRETVEGGPMRPLVSLLPQSAHTVDAQTLEAYLAASIPDLTFQEAYERTGRNLNITVTGLSPRQAPRLLNAITSPNVLIRSAVMASCSIYGIYPPVTLMSKNEAGERVPYLPDMQWIDGSFVDDLPAKRLGRLYGVNHFICSMTNPAALAMTPDPDAPSTPLSLAFDFYLRLAKAATTEALKLSRDHVRINSPVISLMQHLSYSVLAQDYTADINIFLRNRWEHPHRLLAPPTREVMQRLIREGELATWEKVEMVRNCTAISREVQSIIDDRGWHNGSTATPRPRKPNPPDNIQQIGN